MTRPFFENACGVFARLSNAAEKAREGVERFVAVVRELDKRLGMTRYERRVRGARGVRRATGTNRV